MCGIVAYKDTTVYALIEDLKEAWTLMSHRGTDSYGVLLINDEGEVKILKALSDDKLLKQLKIQKDNEFKYVVAHNRAASIGDINLNLAHPIKKGNVIVIHNGTNVNLLNIVTSAESDTEAIAKILNERNNDFVKNYINDWLDGSGVIIGYDIEKHKWLFWKDKSRPLVKVKSTKDIYSEPFVIGERYNIINNTRTLIERKKFDHLFIKGKSFKIDEMLYPGYCLTCKRKMLVDCIESHSIKKKHKKHISNNYIWNNIPENMYWYKDSQSIYDYYEDLCWECALKVK